ncbi:MAG: methyltransferase domain-containing protein [Bryobacterales bacterium]|nr:methyltransferase domain-containing protein [Bryobacterales bacterium]MBV9396835.1 methyltransferase domain-containing protein [Bryobacterales bacterium]
MKSPTLRAVARQYHERLQAIKAKNRLDGVDWYPWASMAAMETLDGFLNGDVENLRALIASAPVLDVGCGDGDVGFFLESLGARVDAIDHAPTNYNALVGVRALKRILDSKIGIHPVDLDQRPNLPAANYGLAIMLGVLYHLKNPFLVLETLARSSRHIFLSTRIASLTPDRKVSFGSLPLAYLVDEDELNHDATNFWIFSEAALKRLVRRSGWHIRHYTTLGAPASQSDPVSTKGDVRAYIFAESRLAPPPTSFHIERGWHELEYDSWRWTDRRFSAVLDLSSPLAPATLHFRFNVPKQVLEQRPALTLWAAVNGVRLQQSTFSTPGEHEYVAAIPALPAGEVKVEFELDGTIRPGDGDQRELGVLVEFSGAPPVQIASS